MKIHSLLLALSVTIFPIYAMEKPKEESSSSVVKLRTTDGIEIPVTLGMVQMCEVLKQQYETLSEKENLTLDINSTVNECNEFLQALRLKVEGKKKDLGSFLWNQPINGWANIIKGIFAFEAPNLLCLLTSTMTLLRFVRDPALLKLLRELPSEITEQLNWYGKHEQPRIYQLLDLSANLLAINGSNTVKVLKEHTDEVDCVTFSPNGQLLASCSKDRVCIWDVQTLSCTTTFIGHTDSIIKAVFNQDGRLLATASEDRTIKIWDLKTRKCKVTFLVESPACSVCFSSDSKLLAGGLLNGQVMIWNVDEQTCNKSFTAHTQGVYSVAFSPNDDLLATGSADKTVKVWDLSTESCTSTFSGYPSTIHIIRFAVDKSAKKYLITYCSRKERSGKLLDIQSGTCVRSLQVRFGWASDAALSPDGKLVVFGLEDGTIKIDRALHDSLNFEQSLLCLSIIKGDTVLVCPHSHLHSVYKSLDERIKDLLVRIYPPRSLAICAQCQSELKQEQASEPDIIIHTTDDKNMTISREMVKASGFLQGQYDGYKTNILEVPCTISEYLKLAEAFFTVSTGKTYKINEFLGTLSFDEHIALIKNIFFFDMHNLIKPICKIFAIRLLTKQCINQIVKDPKYIELLLTLAPEMKEDVTETVMLNLPNNLIKKTIGNYVKQQIESKEKVLSGHQATVFTMCFSPNNKMIATGSADKTAKVWNVQSAQCIATCIGHDGAILSAAFSSDNKLLATSSADKTIRLWNVRSGQCIKVLCGHDDDAFVSSMCFSPNNALLVTGTHKGTLKVWGLANEKVIFEKNVHEDAILSIAFSRDGKVIATGSCDKTAKVLDLTTSSYKGMPIICNNAIYKIDFPGITGEILATYSDTNVIWEIETGNCLYTSYVYSDSEVRSNGYWSTAIISFNGWLSATTLNDNDAAVLIANGLHPLYEELTLEQLMVLACIGQAAQDNETLTLCPHVNAHLYKFYEPIHEQIKKLLPKEAIRICDLCVKI